MDTTAASDTGACAEAHVDEPDAQRLPAPAIDLARLARLFRHTVRVGGVNPLLHLMPRFRKEPKP